MAAVAPAADQATDLLQNLSLEPKNKTHDSPEVTKKPSGIQYGSADGAVVPSAQVPSQERSVTPLLQDVMDASMCYIPSGYPSTTYYYGGYDGAMNEWKDFARYANPDGVEMPPPGVYGDLYHHGYGYAPYGAYPSPGSTVATMGHDGQLYGPQHYQYPAQYYQTPTPAPKQVSPSQGEVSTSAAADQPPISVDDTKANSNVIVSGNADGSTGAAAAKPSQQNSSLASTGLHSRGVLTSVLPSSGFQDPRFGFDAMRSPIPWFDAPVYPDVQHRPAITNTASSTTSARNQNLRPLPHFMGMHAPRPVMGPAAPGIMNRMYPNNRMYRQYGNAFETGPGFHTNGYDSRTNGRWGLSMDSKYKPRGRGNGFYTYINENLDGLGELNRGPRAGRFRTQKGFGQTFTIAVKGQSLPTNRNIEDASLVPDKEQYNRADFAETYSDAKFFVIKSYSEDDVHKSIKYNVWASTPNGNKKLDAAYQEAKEKYSGCPVFLFFSVNTSGQFVGVAEMVGPVDFNKTVDYWQQDKWNGCFPVKWHIVKDVPNGFLKHITLENNDNKPVTNSRDTQEVKLEQGLQILKLFKDHKSKTSILDDFTFYETRQKVMQEKKAKQQQLQKKVVDGMPVDIEENSKNGTDGKPGFQIPLVPVLKKEPVQGGLVELKTSKENGVPAVSGVDPKDATPVTEKHTPASSIAHGC
ncbi:YTH domain-containing protein ECT4-like [Phoenix dactylifera]|uniref:YTH domain-containing family protein n=1 Tax=Phoenix dactylifera TaxID=42345 RepID=A0A8B8ZPD1_PHODC|nr:YTH domain-containing protein ECT4-like [Phoenix dactylifera]